MNTLLELFILFFKLGAFTIGGGVAMLPLLQHSLTEEKKWFSTEEFVDIIAVCQSLPGVIAINMATYVGYKKKGFIGSLVSTFGVVIPSFCMILVIAAFLSNLGDSSVVSGAMAGLRAAALGLVVVAVIQMGSVVFKGKWTILAATLSFVLIAVLGVNTAYVILLFVILGVVIAAVKGPEPETIAVKGPEPETGAEKAESMDKAVTEDAAAGGREGGGE